MILDKLTLRDFGLFRGTQVFDLSPAERQGKGRPIVLFGGINGGGKTTLFDSIQLALYGPRARCSRRSRLSYEEFLRQSIHLGADPARGAAVHLSFRYATDGQDHLYEVRRGWKVEDDKLRESLLILQDELPNYSLVRSWPQLVEELIPLEIAQLFFFDGEKIRSLAEDASSAEALGAAIKALLGLDLVERLIADTTVLQTRLARQAGTPEHRAQVDALEQQQRALQAEVDRLVTERASLENRRQRARGEQQAAEDAFASVGGKHWDARQARGQRLAELNGLIGELESQLVALASGECPLALVGDLLGRVERQDVEERRTAEADLVQRLLAQRDNRLVEVLRGALAPAGLLRLVEEQLRTDRQARLPATRAEQRLALPEGARSMLHHLREHRLAELVAEARVLLEKLGLLTQEREDTERALAATPADTDMARVVERLKSSTQAHTVLEEQGQRLEEAVKAHKGELADVTGKLERLWQGQVEKEFEREDAGRLVRLAGRTRTTMQEFLQRATGQKIDRLSALITESFRFLLRKQTLVERILIDPATFGITLLDAGGQGLPRHRLSEGEKQIFAISVLWGLARAAARPLPAVIDTPMARLDAAHRLNLVERYFPHASHQVIVFSTDTEVDRHYYQALQPALARAYHLSYDERDRATVGVEGYFW